MILSQIAAMSRNRVIGKDNGLPWSLPEDFKFFKDTTKGHLLIMGRKTYDSLVKPLPQRFHIVISRNPPSGAPPPQVVFVRSLDEALQTARALAKDWPPEVFIIGGGEIYRQSLAVTDRIYLTVIEKDFAGDAYFPEFSESEFRLKEKRDRHEPMEFSFRLYERVPAKSV